MRHKSIIARVHMLLASTVFPIIILAITEITVFYALLLIYPSQNIYRLLLQFMWLFHVAMIFHFGLHWNKIFLLGIDDGYQSCCWWGSLFVKIFAYVCLFVTQIYTKCSFIIYKSFWVILGFVGFNRPTFCGFTHMRHKTDWNTFQKRVQQLPMM